MSRMNGLHLALAIVHSFSMDDKKTVDGILNLCEDAECSICSQIICPFDCALHFHHDGCPACEHDASQETF